MKNTEFDMSDIVQNIDKVREMKAQKKKKPTVSIKPLKFDISPEDSPLKVEIVKRINEKNLTYSDIYNYCTNIRNGDNSEGQNLGYNIIYGLKHRHSMIDITLAMLADFLELDILFVERKKPSEETTDTASSEENNIE